MSRMHHRGDYRQGRPASSGVMLHGKGRQVICPNRAGSILHHHHGRLVKPIGGAISPLLTNLTSWWRMDEVGGVREDSVGGLDLTDFDTVGSAAGKIGNSASFVKENTEMLYVDAGVGNEVVETTAGTWSISGFVYILKAENVGAGRLWLESDIGITNTFCHHFLFYNAAPYLTVRIYDIDGGNKLVDYNASADVIDGWNHVVVWMEGDGKIRASFNDNTPKVSAALANTARACRRLGFGGAVPSAGLPLTCKWDLVGVWDRILTAEERTELNNGGLGVDYPF